MSRAIRIRALYNNQKDEEVKNLREEGLTKKGKLRKGYKFENGKVVRADK